MSVKKETYNVAVVGATGAVGGEMVRILEERKFPVAELALFASEKSFGKKIRFCGRGISISQINDDSFKNVDIVLFSAGSDISRKYVPLASSFGAVVIDNTSAFRMEDDIPLVIPEVNPDDIGLFRETRVIANPNCSTIQMIVALYPLHIRAGIKRIVVDTYQAVSGAGLLAVEELSKQVVALLSGSDAKSNSFPHRIAFNCIPHIGIFDESGNTEEENKLIKETQKILNDDSILISATAVRVPVFYGHSEAVHVEFKSELSPDDARSILGVSEGVTIVDNPNLCEYPMPSDVAGKDDVFVGRLRLNSSMKNGLSMWISADNIRKGGALNAIQIAELLIKDYI